VKPLPELTGAVVQALVKLHSGAVTAHNLAAIGAPIEQVREAVDRVGLDLLQGALNAIAALEIALEPAAPVEPVDEPGHVHLELKELCDALDACGARLRLGTGTIALDYPEPADVHAAHPERMAPCPVCGDRHEAVVQRNGVTIIGCPRLSGDESYLFSSDYAVPLGEVDDELEEASRATGIPLPKAVPS
jgi:hypothetical protein